MNGTEPPIIPVDYEEMGILFTVPSPPIKLNLLYWSQHSIIQLNAHVAFFIFAILLFEMSGEGCHNDNNT